MTESMLTKVARETVHESGFKWESAPQSSWRASVRRTILAMREPNDAVREIAAKRGISLENYQAMIDLILAEPPWPAKQWQKPEL